LRSETALVIQDETDLLLFPPLRSGWARQGEPAEVMLSGFNDRRVVFGAMNLRTGRRLLLIREHQRSVDFQFFLKTLRKRYGSRPIALLLDEDSSHTAKGSVALAEQLDIVLLWLPKRSPKLNPMDTLWGQAKDVISANKQHATVDQQAARFITFLQSLSNKEALQTAGVLSDNFWLRSVL
jgi:DDE superfamily endonuclease